MSRRSRRYRPVSPDPTLEPTKNVQVDETIEVSVYEPLVVSQPETIRVFSGCDPNNCDLEQMAVFEYTLRRHASQPVVLVWMRQSTQGPWSGWRTEKARTPFSHFRWGIPAACDFAGKAIYADVDFIWRADIAELWNQPLDRVVMLRNPDGKLKTCCMLIDCSKAKGHFSTIESLRKMPDAQDQMLNYFRSHRELLASFPEGQDWNCIDLKGCEDVNDSRIKAIHYSRIETQPSAKHAIARLKAEGRQHWYTGEIREHWRPELVALFDELLAEAVAAGYALDRYRRSTLIDGQTRRNFKYREHKGRAIA